VLLITLWIKELTIDRQGGTIEGYVFFIFSSGRLGVQMADGSFANFISLTNVNDGTFHHVAVTVDRDSTTGGKLYVDGTAVLTFDPTSRSGSLDNNADFLIGGHIDFLPGVFNGEIDELELYNVALSASEIQAIFNAGSAGKCKLLQPFASFSPEVEFELGPNPNDDSLEVEVDFTLGNDSNGLNIPIEIVSLELTGVSPITIPAGSFEMRDDGSFRFEGTVNGVPVEAEIEPNPELGANAFTFELEADNQNLPGTPEIDFPVTMTLTIGDDQGTADVDAEVED